MPGPHTVIYLYSDYDGGVDLWHGDSYNPRGQWFAVWHNTAANWWCNSRWSFRHWVFWPSVMFDLLTDEEYQFALSSETILWSDFLAAKGNAKGKGKQKGHHKGKGKGKHRRGQRNPDGRGQFHTL